MHAAIRLETACSRVDACVVRHQNAARFVEITSDLDRDTADARIVVDAVRHIAVSMAEIVHDAAGGPHDPVSALLNSLPVIVRSDSCALPVAA